MSADTRRRLRTTAECSALVALFSTIVPVAYLVQDQSGWIRFAAGPALALMAVPTALLIVRVAARRNRTALAARIAGGAR